MDMWVLSGITIGLFILLMVLGIRIGYAALISGVISLAIIYPSFNTVGIAVSGLIYTANAQYALTVIPLFVLMGYIALEYRIGEDIFYTARCWLGRLPGGLAMGTTLGCAFFGAINGSSPVACAVFGKLAVPEMDRAGYDKKLSVGSVAGAGGLSELIPPSTMLVLYAILSNQSVGKLLIAGFIPGIISAILLCLMIYLRCIKNRKLGPPGEPIPFSEKIRSLKYAVPVALVLIIILGGMLTGIFTPTEAGGCSAFVMLICGLATRKSIDFRPLGRALVSTARTTCMIFILLVGIKVMTTGIIATGSMTAMVDFFASVALSPYILLLFAIVIYFILGCFVGVNAMLVMTVPFFVPVFAELGFDPVWFGVLVVILIEIGLMTPPLAGNIFVVAQVTDTELSVVYRSVPWFIAVHLVMVVIIILFPNLALFLPSLM